MDIKNLSILESATIKEALKVMGTGEIRLRIVLNDSGKFVGLISDPDIRRGLSSGMNLDSSIMDIVKRNPVIAKVGASKNELFRLSAKHNIYEIPLVDEKGEIVEIVSVLKLLDTAKKPNKVVIMAGGLGTRLRPLTEHIPKPMLKVGNKPILQIILENFKAQGFYDIVLCVNYKSHVIEDYFGDGSKFELNIEYVREDTRLGTAGALSLLTNLPTEPFIVMNGDILSDIDFNKMLDFHIKQECVATMGVREFSVSVPYGVVESELNNIKSIIEKPTYSFFVSAGIYVLNPSVLNLIPKNRFYDMPSLFEVLSLDSSFGNAKSYLINEYWIDIGRMEEYERANSDYTKGF